MRVSIKISRNSAFSASDKPKMLFFLLINVKMPTIVGIFTFTSTKNFMLSMKFFITSGPDCISPDSVLAFRSTLTLYIEVAFAK